MDAKMKEALINSGKLILFAAGQAALFQLGLEVQKHLGLAPATPPAQTHNRKKNKRK